MAYIGRSVEIGMFEKQVLTADSSTTTFTLTFAVGSANSLLVVYGGVIQEPAVAYSVSGGGQQIVFSEAPATGTTTYIIYLGKQLTTPRAAGQETTKQTFAGDGTTTLFTLTDPPVVPAGIMVFVDGILQREGSGNNYVSGGSTINFNGAPDSGAEIDVYTLVKEKVSIDTVADGSITRAKMASTFPYWDAQGNFGIGATPYNVVGSTMTSLTLNGSAYGSMYVQANGGAVRGTFNATTANNTVNLTALTNHPLTFATNDTERVRIDSAGNVGIGTATPYRQFQVGNYSANAVMALGSSPTGTGTFVFSTSDSAPGRYVGTIDYNHTSNYLAFTTNASERVRIDSSGNVGLGTTSPNISAGSSGSQALTISASASARNALIELKGTRTSADQVSSYIRSFSNSGATPGVDLQFYRGTTDTDGLLTISTSGSERMRITSAGEVLIGYTNAGSGGKLVVNGITYQNQTANGTSGSPVVSGGYLIGPNDPNIYAGIRALNSYLSSNASQLAFYVTNTTGSAYEAGRFDKDGNMLMGMAANVGGARMSIQSASATGVTIETNGSSGYYPMWFQVAGTQRGYITSTTGGTTYNTSSDYRLKENVAPMTGALAKVEQLNPCTFTWKETGDSGQGFIAHELAEIVPECVTGEKNGTFENGDPFYQGIDTSFLVATLTAAIQELKAIVDAQAVEIAALKAK